jgi:mercuric ion binding protein
MRRLSILLLAALCATPALAATTIRAEVNGMVCAFCAQGIDKKMRALPQTRDVYVNLKSRIVAVELKDGQTLSHDTVRDLVRDAGYEVASIRTVAETAAQIKAASPKAE